MHPSWHSIINELNLIDNQPQRLLRWILKGLGMDDGTLYFTNYNNLSPHIKTKIDDTILRLIKHEPLSKILESCDFFNRSFKTTAATLDPRFDTEVMIEYALKHFDKKKSYRFLDLGTGTGCILITLLLEFKNSTGIAVDISKEALAIARYNCQFHNVIDRIQLIESDWLSNVPNQTFDVIFSNPPYIENNYPLDQSVLYDPHQALFAGDDGLKAYQTIFKTISNFCTHQTKLIFEIGFNQEQSVINIAKLEHFKYINTIYDQQSHPRTLIFQMT